VTLDVHGPDALPQWQMRGALHFALIPWQLRSHNGRFVRHCAGSSAKLPDMERLAGLVREKEMPIARQSGL